MTGSTQTSSNTEALNKIKDELLHNIDLPLYSYRKENNYFPVIGDGDHEAEVMFIGEAPGKNEALTGKPFCGAAGRILDGMLQAVKLDRTSVYITNTVKDRPPENRDPLPAEIEAYVPYLDRQIDILKPKAILTLGRFSMAHIMQRFSLPFEPISKCHGKAYTCNAPWGSFVFMPLYHPASALYNPSLKQTLVEDMKKAISAIGKI